jgi:hypothetical protein
MPSSVFEKVARFCSCFALVAAVGCSSSDSPATGGTDAATASDGGAGPVSGKIDDHCGTMVQKTNPAVCEYKAPADAGAEPEETPELRFNAESDDDDCKYHISFTTTPVSKNADVSITLKVTMKDGGGPAKEADPEVNIITADDKHIAPETTPTVVESPDGTYKIGPVKFDQSGRWKLIFHLYEECSDIPKDSQHGHASFWFDVP